MSLVGRESSAWNGCKEGLHYGLQWKISPGVWCIASTQGWPEPYIYGAYTAFVICYRDLIYIRRYAAYIYTVLANPTNACYLSECIPL
jgi:hypothetical protein